MIWSLLKLTVNKQVLALASVEAAKLLLKWYKSLFLKNENGKNSLPAANNVC